MYLITRQSKANTAAARWKEQYFRVNPKTGQGEWDKAYGDQRPRQDTYADLLTAKTPEDCLAAMGNDWCSCTCDECDKHVDAVVEVGQPMGCESATAHLCLPCLEKALKLMKGGQHA